MSEQYAVHSIHAPAVLMTGNGHTLNGAYVIPLGEPIHVADTLESAEEWRRDMLAAQANRV